MVTKTNEQAQRIGAPRAIALCRNFGGELDFLGGRWPQAETALTEAVGLYRKVGSASGEALSLQRLGVLYTAMGRLEEAMALFNEGVAVAEHASMRSHCLTRLYASITRNRLAARDYIAAEQAMQAGQLTAQRHGYCVTCNALLLPEAVRNAINQGQFEVADNYASELAEISAKYTSRSWLAMAKFAQGRVLVARQQWHAASAALVQAQQAYSAIGQLYEAARAMMVQAQALSHCPDQTQAAYARQAEAKEIFQRLGAAGIED